MNRGPNSRNDQIGLPRSRLKLIRCDPPPVGHNCEYVKARNALILEAVKIADSLVEVVPPGQGDDEAVKRVALEVDARIFDRDGHAQLLRATKSVSRPVSGAEHACCMTLHDTLLSANRCFLSFQAFSPGNQKRRVSLVFSLRNGGLAGGGIEPPTRGFSVHCSAN